MPSWVRGIFLGYSRGPNSFLIGYWGFLSGKSPEWVTTESESVRLTDYLVRDINDLRPDSNSVSVSANELNQMVESPPGAEIGGPEEEDEPGIGGYVQFADAVAPRQELRLSTSDLAHLASTGTFESARSERVLSGRSICEEPHPPVVTLNRFPFELEEFYNGGPNMSVTPTNRILGILTSLAGW